nr:hypothetical protein CFP56_22315 [Quercus suber]
MAAIAFLLDFQCLMIPHPCNIHSRNDYRWGQASFYISNFFDFSKMSMIPHAQLPSPGQCPTLLGIDGSPCMHEAETATIASSGRRYEDYVRLVAHNGMQACMPPRASAPCMTFTCGLTVRDDRRSGALHPGSG